MRKPINDVVLLMLALLAIVLSSTRVVVEGRATKEGANHNNEHKKQRKRIRTRNVPSREGSGILRGLQGRREFGARGKGKGGKGGGSKSSLSGSLDGRGFLPPRIDPIPFVNCIPHPDSDIGRSGAGGGGGGSSKAAKSSKGKGHNRRADRLQMGQMGVVIQGRTRRLRKGSKSASTLDRQGGGGRGGMGMMMGARRLPFCPITAPTQFPTILPSFTPLPSVTPYPSFTPFPSITPYPTFTPFPSFDDGPAPATTAPTDPTTPTVSVAPSVSRNPSVGPTTVAPTTSTGTFDILIYSRFGMTYFNDRPEDIIRDLTADEYVELRTLMDEYYTAEFQADTAFSGDFDSYNTVFTSMTYSGTSTPNIVLDFDANFAFNTGSAVTAAQVLAKMESLNYMLFITDYLMRTPPTNQLDAVQMVNFNGGTLPL